MCSKTSMAMGISCLALLSVGCADAPLPAPTGPRIDGSSKSSVMVGEELELYGYDFESAVDGDTELHFVGEFTADDGTVEPVDYTTRPLVDPGEPIDDGEDAAPERPMTLVMSRFGPFNNPFSAHDRPGLFRGVVFVDTIDAKGVRTRSPRKTFALQVLPSILIEELQPLDADCAAPAVRAIGGLFYKMRVRPVGLKPVRFEYTLSGVNGVGLEGTVQIVHDYSDGRPVAADTLGVDEPILFDPVPPNDQFYAAGIRVVAFDAQGSSVETALPITVHRPLEVVFDGESVLAERYEPVPVSGCMPGSISTRVSYSETRTESRQRSVSVTVSRSFGESTGNTVTRDWHEGISEGTSESHTLGSSDTEDERLEETYGLSYGQSEANRIGFSNTEGETWGWEVNEGETNEEYRERVNELWGSANASGTVGASGEGSIPGFAKVSGHVSTTVGVEAGARTAGTHGERVGVSTRRGQSMGGSNSETNSFGSTTTEGQSRSINDAYALSRSRSRQESDTASRDNSRTWDMSEGASQSELSTKGRSEAEAQTWTDSVSDSTTQSFSGHIPLNRVGMFYRQTTRTVRRAEVRAFDQCGVARHMGELQFSEWAWAPNLAIAASCDKGPPKTDLPPAACFVEPCGG